MLITSRQVEWADKKNVFSIEEQTNKNLSDAERNAEAPLECRENMAEKY